MSKRKAARRDAFGVWLIGARGSVATTTVAGAGAVGGGFAAPTGLVTALPVLAQVALADLSRLVFGGHDVVDTALPKRAEALAAAGVLPTALLGASAEALDAAEANIRAGVEGAETPLPSIERIQADLDSGL